ncbi:MAG: ParB/RepB/Spo0J family partition protein, partial [Kiloniellaceae bacterium]
EVVAGERRWRAAQMAGIAEVPAVVRHISDREALALALIENVQRLNLTPIETAEGYRRLMEEFGYTQDDMARAVCKSRAQVANMLRLLALPEAVRRLVQDGRLSAGHARALIGADDAPALAERVVAKGLSVRQTERLARARATAGHGDDTRAERLDRKVAGPLAASPLVAAPLVKDLRLAEMERELSALLGMRVSVETGPQGQGGTLKVHFPTVADLEGVLRRLSEVAVEGKVKTKDGAMAARTYPARTAHRPGARPDMAANRNEDAYGPARTPGTQRDLEALFPTPAP